ncbi:MAG: prepilin-type N-terminal cleavage/methylation domain-containing protein [Deltaproteobacteria bacterium]|nr:prepilin-type N-terminal cleavage/methylation domain-containing protein [Deltaproteobacteria bacterium]
MAFEKLARRERRGPPGFTLLEVLAVVLLTSIVIGSVLNHYVNLNRAIERATSQTGRVRRSVALLDRLARDLEAAVLVTKPEDVDPLFHPWRFYGASERDTSGADQLKFVTRARRPRNTGHESDLEVVAYTLRHAEDGESFELMRWASPRLDAALDPELPSDEADGAMLLADRLADFGVTFYDATGARFEEWDSSQLEQSSTLPTAVEIHVAFADADAEEPEYEATAADGYSRKLVLPVRELDLQELLDPTSLVSGGQGNAEESEEAGDEGELLAAQQCLRGPCGRLSACQAIDCNAEMGKHGSSTDTALEQTQRTNMSFCQWRGAYSTLHHLIKNPECLP